MAFRINAPIDSNQHKGLLGVNSITGDPLAITGLSLTNAQPIHVAIVDGSGSQITAFTSGTQYTDGGTPPTHPIGTVPIYNNAGTWASVSTTNKLPVNTGLIQPTTPSDTQPVSGTFWQATQPISAASLPLPTGAAIAANQQTDALTNTQLRATAVPVSGTFYQATQPVSIATMPTTPVTGTFWQATQPVSVASIPTHAVTQSGTWNVGLSAGSNAVGTVGTTSAVVNVNQKTVSTTAAQLSVTSTIPTNGIIVRALSTNSAPIFVGGSGVTTSNGYELVAGEAVSFSCNLNTLYIISAASTTDKACYNVE